MNEKLMNEIEACTSRWENTGLLKKLPDYKKGEVAILLENQRLYNQIDDDNGDKAQFKRLSIPLVRRIVPNLLAFELATVQPMLGPTALVYHFSKNKLVETDIVAHSMKMKAIWCVDWQQDLRSQHNLSMEAELAAVLAQEITLEFNRMFLSDLRTNAALKKTIDYNHVQGEVESEKLEAVREHIYDVADESNKLYGRPFPNWIVTSLDMAKAIVPGATFNSSGLGIEKMGVFATDKGDIDVYADPLFVPDGILIGYKGEHQYDAGYILSPYVMLAQTPVVLDPNTFMPRKGIISRFGKKLVDSTYYAYLKVENFFLEEEEKKDEPVTFNNGCGN